MDSLAITCCNYDKQNCDPNGRRDYVTQRVRLAKCGSDGENKQNLLRCVMG